MDLQPLELIRRNRKLYLGNDEPSGQLLAVRLAECALISGVYRVEVRVLAEGWMAVAGDSDWITPNLPDKLNEPSLQRAFVGMIPLRGGRINEIRFEVIVTAFSDGLAVKSREKWMQVTGESPPKAVLNGVANVEFAVVFRPVLRTQE
jgi:hypothetical protein